MASIYLACCYLSGNRIFCEPFSENGSGRLVSDIGKVCADSSGSCFSCCMDDSLCCDGNSLGRILGKNLQRAIGLWWIQLAFNFSWSIVFFYLTSPWWGLLVILLLDGLVYAFLDLVRKKDRWAAICFLPYFIWLILASYLNLYVCLNN